MHTPEHSVQPPAGLLDGSRFLLPVRVYYEDTDAIGVVFYANYLRFCERARTEWLRLAGYEQARLAAETQRVFVVRSLKADYHAAGFLDDVLTVVTTLDRLGGASLHFAQRVLRGDELLFEATVVVACMDWNKKKAVALPAELRAQLEKFIEK